MNLRHVSFALAAASVWATPATAQDDAGLQVTSLVAEPA